MESQQELEQARTEATTAANPDVPKAERKGNQFSDADQKRKLQALHLQREFILSQRTSHPHRRTALATALTDIEEKLAELGWTIHL